MLLVLKKIQYSSRVTHLPNLCAERYRKTTQMKSHKKESFTKQHQDSTGEPIWAKCFYFIRNKSWQKWAGKYSMDKLTSWSESFPLLIPNLLIPSRDSGEKLWPRKFLHTARLPWATNSNPTVRSLLTFPLLKTVLPAPPNLRGIMSTFYVYFCVIIGLVPRSREHRYWG